MNLLADESVEKQIVERLRRDGHIALYVAEMEPSIPDDVVLERANEQLGGVILLRLAGLMAETKAEIVSGAIKEHEAEFPDHFSVISPGRVRIRAAV
ncbi:MAG: DUF5615 family PIN-like protein [Pyrinomonadaceae bacterium]